jgi:uncharacterized protein (DUF1684 family)
MSSPRFRQRTLLTTVACILSACDPTPPLPQIDPTEHAAAVETWHAGRIETLTRPDGWLALVALHWLDEGTTTFGADPASDLALTGTGLPAHIGTFTREGRAVRFDAEPGVRVTAADSPISSIILRTDSTAADITLHHATLQWLVIARDGRLAVRVRDAASPVRTGFNGIDMFPVDVAWHVPARFIHRDPPDTIQVPSILGSINATPSPGIVEFEHRGRTYRLALWKDSDDLANFFTAFADSTNGATTYGGGRFLWVNAPDAEGRTFVDFNRSYNPPCVFTDYATCPLPPRQNRLPFPIEAGEKTWVGGD